MHFVEFYRAGKLANSQRPFVFTANEQWRRAKGAVEEWNNVSDMTQHNGDSVDKEFDRVNTDGI